MGSADPDHVSLAPLAGWLALLITGTAPAFPPESGSWRCRVFVQTGVSHAQMLPAAGSHYIGSDSPRRFAIVIVGGLLVALLIGVILLPTLHASMAGPGDVLPGPEEAQEY